MSPDISTLNSVDSVPNALAATATMLDVPDPSPSTSASIPVREIVSDVSGSGSD